MRKIAPIGFFKCAFLFFFHFLHFILILDGGEPFVSCK
nr:hypothetical protein UQVBLVYK_UQVBLVYK_CDS_0008 [Microvirus sp.]